MAQVAKGTLKRILSKTPKKATLYSFVLKERDEFFNCGFNPPAAKEGDVIEFQYSQNNYGLQVDVDSIKVITEAQVQAVQEKASSPVRLLNKAQNVRDDYWTAKAARDTAVTEPMIQYQNATGIAKDICIAALNAGILPVTGKDKNVKFDTFLECIGTVRDELFTDYRKRSAQFAAGDYDLSNDKKAQTFTELETAGDWDDDIAE